MFFAEQNQNRLTFILRLVYAIFSNYKTKGMSVAREKRIKLV